MRKSFFFFIALVVFSNVVLCNTNGLYSFSEEEKLFKPIANIEIATAEGEISLSDLYDKSPIILVLVFTRCTGICSPLLSNVKENIRQQQTNEKYKVLVLSFDSSDSISGMLQLAKRYNLDEDKQWIFATTDRIEALNASVGFNPVWDSTSQQFDHEALVVGVNGNGYIVKKLNGLRASSDFRSLIKEINSEFVLSYPLPRKNMLFSCFTYDPATGKKKISVGMLVMLLPVVLTLVVVAGLATIKRKPNE
ncbi:MAG: hypothetical protein M9931_07335 [Chitinophagales bacterium]|nr:hypothetical protein [Chitinophagales bacterium]HRP39579.1 hypothetical protein [Chitinophagales bacterium]